MPSLIRAISLTYVSLNAPCVPPASIKDVEPARFASTQRVLLIRVLCRKRLHASPALTLRSNQRLNP